MALEIATGRWSYTGNLADRFIAATQKILGRTLERRGVQSVTINSHGRATYEPQKKKGEFHIHINGKSYSDDLLTTQGLEKMWKFSTGFGGCNCGNLLQPSGEGLLIVEPGSNYSVAELVGNSLYILFDLNSHHIPEDSRDGILTAIFNEAAQLLGGEFPSLAQLASGKFILTSVASPKQVLDRVNRSRKEITANISYATELEHKLKKLQATGGESNLILERIASIPEIKDIKVVGGKLILQTHTMYGYNPKQKLTHEYGEFRMVLTFGEHANATFRNTTRKVDVEDYDTYGHPHVDRAGDHWCQGEGAGILKLLQDFEFEAAILFALKAIDSVNDEESQGNYMRVLARFPTVEKREEYPDKEAFLNPETRLAFARIFDKTSGQAGTGLEKKIADIRQAISAEQGNILQGTLDQTLEKLTGTPGNKKGDQTGNGKVRDLINGQLGQIRKLPQVKSASIGTDMLIVMTRELTASDSRTRKRIPIGIFEMGFDFSSGSISVVNRYLEDRNVLKAYPELLLPSTQGELPLGQLTSTLPELLGNLELETAVSLCLDFITNFTSNAEQGKDSPAKALAA